MENVSASEVYQLMKNVYGTNSMCHRSAWYRNFHSERSSTDIRSQPGQAHVVIIKEAVASVNLLMRINQQITTQEITVEMCMSKGSVHKILHERLQYRKVCALYAPKHFTAEQKIHYMSISL
ncbi:hypothetical protein HNY73_014685 [Argiope bruennichi]|uniref:Mos1 transposase HTH domain-containing protein n=1 Tax=Argiope bruennichi TaxID=94029 RepID=A0A8T0EU82_ARGBR|nr:hypothetical protein HNY73_014685 [Argiope bruennichi]